MPDNESLKPDAINKETLELLQLRLEGKIRGDFLKSVAIPVGGGGLVAIGLAIWVWIPTQVREVFENKRVQDQIERTIQDNVVKYFADETVQTTLAQRVQLQVNRAVESNLTNYFASADGKALVGRLVAESSGSYFRTAEMETQVRGIVTDYLKTDGKKMLTETINAALKPTTNALASSVLKNRDRLLYEFEQQSFLGQPKESVQALDRFLETGNVKKIQREGKPVVLTKQIRPGYQYDVGIINQYVDSFFRSFGDQFKYVAIQYGPDQHLVALIPARQFDARFKREPRSIFEVLNSQEQMPETEVRKQFATFFGKETVRSAQAEERVVAVLTNPVLWPTPDNLIDEVAVVDGKQRLLATTTRQRLIEGILGMP